MKEAVSSFDTASFFCYISFKIKITLPKNLKIFYNEDK
jgi:hypothetical protein